MDHVPTGDTASDTVHTRRRRMRARAGPLQRGANGFWTPEWLDQSFVLPLTHPEVTDVPNQPKPHHDDLGSDHQDPAPGFVRPSTPEIDFARVIRRSDLGRTASRSAIASSGLAGLTLVFYLLTMSMLALGMAISFGVVALVALMMRVRLETAPVPHLDR